MPKKAVQQTKVSKKTSNKNSTKTASSKKKVKKEPVKEVQKVIEETPVRRKRNTVTIDELNDEYDNLLQKIDVEISKLKESTTKQKGIRFLRSVAKDVKTLKRKSQRLTKKKRTIFSSFFVYYISFFFLVFLESPSL